MAEESSLKKELYTYAAELARAGNYSQAEKILLKVVSQGEPAIEYLLLLGKIYAQQGHYKEAIGQWQKALEIEPENKEAKEAVEKATNLLKKRLSPTALFWRSFIVFVIFALVLSLIYFLGGLRAKIISETKLHSEVTTKEKLLAEVEALRKQRQVEVEALKKQIIIIQLEAETRKDRQRAQVYMKRAGEALKRMQKSWFRKKKYLTLAQDYVALAVKTDPLHKEEYEAFLREAESGITPVKISGNRGFILKSEK
jgi:cytochrome c-type biogenesis protein CcmH/NrfG